MPARRMIVTHVAHETAGARRRADQTNLGGLRGEDGADVFKTRADGRGIPEPRDGLLGVGERGFQPLDQLRRTFGFEVVAAAAGSHEAAAETIAANQRSEVEEVATDFAARRGSGQKRNIVGECAEVAGVIGQAFEFERDGSQPLRAQRRLGPGEGFHDGRVDSGVGNGRVTSHRFHLAHRRAVRPARERLLHSAMLIAERNFQVQDFFARALETEMARLDDARVDGTDRDFVNFGAIHAKEFAVGGRITVCPPHGLEPRVALRAEAVLLPDFALKQVRLRVRRSERGIRAGEWRASTDGESVVGVEGEHCDETLVPAPSGTPNHAHRRAP